MLGAQFSATLARAVNHNVAVATQNQALSAILFLYREVLHDPMPWIDDIVHARKPRRLPVVLTRQEVVSILGRLSGSWWLMGMLLYGAGLRLRVKDIDFERLEIVVRSGKGDKDRVTMLPETAGGEMQRHLSRVRALHERRMRWRRSIRMRSGSGAGSMCFRRRR